MSTLLKRGDLEKHSAIDLDPIMGLHRPSPHSSLAGSLLPSGEQEGDIQQSSQTPDEECNSRQKNTVPLASGEWKDDLCHAIVTNNWNDVKAIINQNPNALTAEILAPSRATALHVAAKFGHVTIVEELLKLLPREFLTTRDSNGDTALTLASWYSGIIQVAECLINKNSNTLVIPDDYDQLPVLIAFKYGHEEMGRYLYSVTPLESLKGSWGSHLLCVCIQAHCFDIVLHLLQQCEELLLVPTIDSGKTPIHDIAILNTAILSTSDLTFWKRWIYNYINIPSTTAINHVSVDIQQEDRSQGDKAKLTQPGHGLLQRLISSTTDNFVGVKKIQELKLLHAQADQLLRLVCKNARKANQRGTMIENALCLAAKEGNVEFVFQVSKAIPEIFIQDAIVFCFNKALEYRQARVFNLIHGLRYKNGLVTVKLEDDGTTLIHKAAMKAPDHVLNRIYAPTLQMQRELQWFKEVESLTPPSMRKGRNKDDMTAEELFRESHRELMKQGEKWIKATASSCSVVGTLIVTIMFAVAFTVPGGNDQNLGYPLFIKQPFFKVFIFSTILSLLSSSTSVLMFLAILTSHYSEDKFLKSIPTKLILGLSFLFISIVSMILTFISAIRLMLKYTNYSWSVLPVTILASIPVFLFILSQFPLLVHTYVSTYRNVFHRKVKPWP